MKELANLKSQLRKEFEGDEKEKNFLIAKVEDLQENIAELEHQLSKKEDSRTLLEKPQELMRTKQLEDAQKHHQRAQEDLFDL
jgi:hypothetical protein